MASTVSESLLTAEQFAELPEPPEGGKMELVQGKVCVGMSVSGTHGEGQIIIGAALREFAREHQLGRATVETGYVLSRDPDTVVSPDAAWIRSAQLPGGKLERRLIESAPTLAVEIVSPSDREGKVLEKVGRYLDAGTDRVWVVQDRTLSVIVFFREGPIETLGVAEVLTSRHAGFEVDGFELPVRQIFEDLV